MATLYVENVPDELYEALRTRARERRRSIAAEVLMLLEENVPTEKELRARRNFLRKLEPLLARHKSAKRFPSTEEMLREDRGR
jgi:plasmid stability protein